VSGLNTQKETNETVKERSTVVISTYVAYLRNQLGISIEGIEFDNALGMLNEKEKEFKLNSQTYTALVNDYSKLVEFSKNLSPFLQSEDAKAIVRSAEEDLKFIIDQVRPKIVLERDRIKEFLEEKIKIFFYTDLIDQIYNKIDPHPDFKGVEFRADFDSETPRLDVLVKNTLNQQKLIPNLYFSTAQINILSLSIFLATALNSKEYNCIFIDDPIQSMDSINVLSTIDLIRGIVATGEKQIILSTHDENFHNLLKKKIPPGMFKSRFLELETFGKVIG
jgi:exonuclease SbcC